MKITYIHHSSFLAETDRCYLLFDYTEGVIPPLSDKPLYIFASHRHGDHFSSAVFDIHHPQVTFILSDDISNRQIPADKDAIRIGPHQENEVGLLKIKTYQSNDEGVAFLVKTDHGTIYHAGDLNHWHWSSEPDDWNQMMAASYDQELALLRDEKIKIAFLPADPRLGDSFYLGIDDFMREVGADFIFPMHLWGDYDTISRLKMHPAVQDYKDKIVDIHQEGESYDIN